MRVSANRNWHGYVPMLADRGRRHYLMASSLWHSVVRVLAYSGSPQIVTYIGVAEAERTLDQMESET